MDNIETIPAKRLLTPVKADEIHFFLSNYTLNLYRGCNHGCIYCDSRSECYHMERFDTVRVKEFALEKLEYELSRKRRSGTVCMGAASDPYNALEERLSITQGALHMLSRYHFGVGMSTKSALIARDAQILQKIGKQAPSWTAFSITTADDELAGQLEPNASKSSERFAAMDKLAQCGVLTGTWLNPVLPFITDHVENMLAIVRKTKEHGGRFVICHYGVTLRTGDREYFYAALKKEPRFSGVMEKYIERFKLDYLCPSPNAQALHDRLGEECDRLGLMRSFGALNEAMREGVPQQISMF